MEPIAIVKKRSRIWMVMLFLLIAVLLVAAALWFMGDAPTSEFGGVLYHPPAWSVPAPTGT